MTPVGSPKISKLLMRGPSICSATLGRKEPVSCNIVELNQLISSPGQEPCSRLRKQDKLGAGKRCAQWPWLTRGKSRQVSYSHHTRAGLPGLPHPDPRHQCVNHKAEATHKSAPSPATALPPPLPAWHSLGLVKSAKEPTLLKHRQKRQVLWAARWARREKPVA